MKYLLDTNICIYAIKKRPMEVFRHLNKLQVGEVGISAITFSELQYGVKNSSYPEQNAGALIQFVAPLEIMDYPAEASEVYGEIRAYLKKKGKLIGPLDLLIAAHSLYLGTTLVTNNAREFRRVPGLSVENWA